MASHWMVIIIVYSKKCLFGVTYNLSFQLLNIFMFKYIYKGLLWDLMSVNFGTLTRHSVHPTLPVLLTKNGPCMANFLMEQKIDGLQGNINRLYEWGELIFGQLASLVPNPSPVKKIVQHLYYNYVYYIMLWN